MIILLIAALAWSCACRPQGALGAYNCDGCSARAAPVCGEDGVSYANACLATCQGTQVASLGACSAQAQAGLQQPAAASFASFADADATAGGGELIPRAAMQAYADEGFVLVGRAVTGSFEPQASYVRRKQQPQQQQLQQQQQQLGGSSSSFMSTDRLPQQQPGGLAAMRKTSTGFVYQLRPRAAAAAFADLGSSLAAASGAGASSPGQLPSAAAAATQPSRGSSSSSSSSSLTLRAAAGVSMAQPVAAVSERAPALSALQQMLLTRMQAGGRRRAARRRRAQRRLLAVVEPAGDGGAGGGADSSSASAASAAGSSSRRRHRRHGAARHRRRLLGGGLGGSLRALAYIIGSDDRTQVDGLGWPYSAVGHFLYATGSCTGVMIGPRAVLTAAHCVYSRKRGMWQEELRFIPHRHRANGAIVEPYGRVREDSITTYSGWINNSNSSDAIRYDIAVVRLANESIGLATGWLGLTWDKRGFDGTIYSVGYPGDKLRGSQWQSTCHVTDSDGSDTRFVNMCDVWPGQSGSPMWERRSQDEYYLRAVMSFESCMCCNADCSCCSDQFNGGCKINALHYANILSWR